MPIGDDPHAVAMATGVNTRAGCRASLEFAFDYAVANRPQEGHDRAQGQHAEGADRHLPRDRPQLYARKYKGRFELETVIVDACAMKLVLNPWQFDVIVTTNLFGDILSDLIAGLVGGLGMAPGANIGADAAIFEAVHGSAPDIAGKGIANPHRAAAGRGADARTCDRSELARSLRTAMLSTLQRDNISTRDLGGTVDTKVFASAVIRRLN